MTASAVEGWFKMSEEDILNMSTYANASNAWPFKNVTEEEFVDLLRYYKRGKWFMDGGIMHIYGSTLNVCGALLSTLLLITLHRRAIVQRNNFYKAMYIISIVNICFCVSDFFYNIFYRHYKLYGWYEWKTMWTMLVVRGFVYSCSLGSDVLTALLTFERYVAVTRPQLHQTLSSKRKLMMPIVGVATTVISSTRFHFTMDKNVKFKKDKFYYGTSDLGTSDFVTWLTIFADAIFPAILLVSVLLLSFLFIMAVVKRRQKRVKQKAITKVTTTRVEPINLSAAEEDHPAKKPSINKESHTSKRETELNNELKSMITLTLSLDALFLLNQLGYCTYFVAELLSARQHDKLSFYNTYQDLALWIFLYKLENYTNVAICLAEIFSHGSNFLLYVAFSGSVRREFEHVLRKVICKR